MRAKKTVMPLRLPQWWHEIHELTWLMVYDEHLAGYWSICKSYELLYIYYLASKLDGAMHIEIQPVYSWTEHYSSTDYALSSVGHSCIMPDNRHSFIVHHPPPSQYRFDLPSRFLTVPPKPPCQSSASTRRQCYPRSAVGSHPRYLECVSICFRNKSGRRVDHNTYAS